MKRPTQMRFHLVSDGNEYSRATVAVRSVAGLITEYPNWVSLNQEPINKCHGNGRRGGNCKKPTSVTLTVKVGISAAATSVPTGILRNPCRIRKPIAMGGKGRIYSQTRIKATSFLGARASERRLGHSMVLGVKMVDNLVANICELSSDR